MQAEIASQLVGDAAYAYRQQRRLAEAAAQQVNDSQFFQTFDAESNSIATIMKHVGGNLRSRWTDFLTSDGEKPDRNRPGEFETANQTRQEITDTWNTGWLALESALASLGKDDLERTITIRGEPHVLQALMRNLAHTSHHAGQIVYLAKLLARGQWQTLSIPRGQEQPGHNYWVR
jgi:hypothetical protein